jgi:hypothetical protein
VSFPIASAECVTTFVAANDGSEMIKISKAKPKSLFVLSS